MGRAHDPKKVLIVEDEPDIRSLAAALLEETELDVVETTTAAEALAYLRDHASEVAVVFTDVATPGPIDGVDLARSVEARYPWIKTIMTSGYIRWPHSGVPASVTFMPKPWRALDVLVAVEKATARV